MYSPTHVVKTKDIVKKLNSGIDFYTAVINKSEAPKYQAVFRRMWDEKHRAARALVPLCHLNANEREEARAFCDDLRKRYTIVQKDIATDTDGTYLKQLTNIESTILKAIDDALSDSQTSEVAACLRLVRTRAQQCCDEMQSLYRINFVR